MPRIRPQIWRSPARDVGTSGPGASKVASNTAVFATLGPAEGILCSGQEAVELFALDASVADLDGPI